MASVTKIGRKINRKLFSINIVTNTYYLRQNKQTTACLIKNNNKMNDLAPLLAFGIVTYGVYSVSELFVRRKERMSIIEKIEKLQTNIDPSILTNQLRLPLFGKIRPSSSMAFKASLLLIGIGIGLIVAIFLEMNLTSFLFQEFSIYNAKYGSLKIVRDTIALIYVSCSLIFGGLGLLIAYLVEQKKCANMPMC
ncbi:DUF6249 domain-containing protein [Viscerimonas tarda]